MLFYGAFVLFLHRGIHLCQYVPISNNLPAVSVIVATRNESSLVERCLDALLAQDYPRHLLEIIVVDDQSQDCTPQVLKRFSHYNKITCLQNSRQGKFSSSKKNALEIGIESATGDLLLFTDTDCTPPSTWTKNIVKKFDPSIGLVAGFSPQRTTKKWLNEILKIDAAAAAIVSAASFGFGRGVTCTGRNLAYRKQAFHDVGGFSVLPDSLSGDDDFMLQAVSKHPQWKVTFAFDPDAVVPADGPNNVRQFLRQKQRHISAGQFYPFAAQAGFASFHVLNLLIWLLAILAVFMNALLFIPLAVKFILDYGILRKFLHHFKMAFTFRAFLLWQILFVYYNTVTGPLGFFKKLKWK